MAIITDNYRTSNANFLFQDIANSDYYVFVSSTQTSSTLNSSFTKNDFLEKTIFGKKISQAETFFMIENNRWKYGTVYDHYDDTIELSSKLFYTVVYPSDNSTGDYRVYKCLFNNYGAPSYNAPNYEPDIEDQIYRMGDGYVWKFMYAITEDEFHKYNALGLAPIIGSSSSTPFVGKSIDHIDVTNVGTNKGYELKSGTIEEVLANGLVIYSPSLSGLSGINNYYSGQNLYVIGSDNSSRLYTIDTYTYSTSTLRATITLLDQDAFIEPTFSFQIFPRIEIIGDGSGAVAIPNINNEGTIESILVLNKGTGYTSAAARVVNPLFGFDPTISNAVDVEAIIRPVLSPINGHATNFKEELCSKKVMVYLTLTEADNLTIPTTNSYTRIGIVKNPEFTSNTSPSIFDNRLRLDLASSTLVDEEIVTQVSGSTVTFRAEVHEVSGNTAFLCSYHGPYQNYDIDGFYDIPLDITKSIVSSQNQFISINSVVRPPYVQKTGEVFYINSFAAITRTPSSNEEYKIILEF